MRWFWFSTVLVWASLSPAVGTATEFVSPDDAERKVVRLTPEEPVEVPWTVDTEEVVVEVDLGEYDYASIELVQNGVDVSITDYSDACGLSPWTVDLRQGLEGVEYVPAVPDGQGVIELTLSPSRPPRSTGSVVLKVGETRRIDRPVEYCRGWRAFLEARMAALSSGRDAIEVAIDHYQRSARLLSLSGDEAALGQARLNQASSEHRILRFQDALHHLSEARRLLADLENAQPSYFDALSQTALIYQRLGQTELAEALYSDALAVATALEDKHRMARALNGRGLALRNLNRWTEALESYERALALASGDDCKESAVLNNLSTVQTRLGRFQDALSLLRRSIELSRGGERPACRHHAAALNSLGILYGRLGRHRIASAKFEEALSLVDEQARMRLLQNFGYSLYQSGDYQRAQSVFLETAELAQAGGDPVAEFSARSNLGRLYSDLALLDKAETQLRRAEQLIDVEDPSISLAALLANRAELALASGAIPRARRAAAQSLEVARAVGSPEAECRALRLVALSALAGGQPGEAANAAQQSVTIAESLRYLTAGYDFRSSLFGEYTSHFSVWIEALLELHSQQPEELYLARALEVAERARSRALLDMLHNADVERSDEIDPELAEFERQLEMLHLERSTSELTRKERLQIDTRLTELQAKILDRESALMASRPEWSELKSPALLDVPAMRSELLDDRSVLLFSFVGEAKSWIWLLTKNDLFVWEMPARRALEGQVRKMLDLMTERSRSPVGEDLASRRQRILEADQEFRVVSKDFSQRVLAPVLSKLAATRVLVVASGPLAYLPFAALPRPDLESWHPLVLDYEWVQVPSASVLASVRRRSRDSTRPRSSRPLMAVVADPVFSLADSRLQSEQQDDAELRLGYGREFRRLPHTGEEAADLAELAGDEAMFAVGFDATAELVRNGDVNAHRIVHFATHGIIDTEFPEASGLVFSLINEEGESIDGYLRLPEIFRLKLQADLIVLSACETALGREIRGEGLMGLTRGFLYAGASSVVASLWTVQDRATREFMSRFYREYLGHGKTVSESMHQAQVSMAIDEHFAPYHWAGFVLQGEWAQTSIRNEF